MSRPWLEANGNTFPYRKLIHVASLKARIGWQSLRTDEFVDDGPFCVTGTDFRNGKVDWSTAYHVSVERYEMDKNIQIAEGDLLVTKDGTIGKVAVVDELPDHATLNSGVFVVRPKTVDLATDFLSWVIRSKVFDDFVAYNFSGSTINHLYQNVFDTFRFPFPDFATQRQIADFLDRETARIDMLIEKKQRFQEQLKAKSNAVIERFYSIGLTSDRSFEGTGLPWLPNIPSDWKITAIKRLVPVKDGTHETPEYVDKTDEAFPLVTSKDFFGEEIDFSGAKFISSEDHHSIYRRSNTETGDILMSMIGGNIGKCLIVKDIRAFSIKNVALFKTCSDQQLAKFILHYLRSSFFDEQLRLLGRGGAQGFIGLGDIRNLQIPVIPPEEMKIIVSEVEKQTRRASSVIDAVQSSIDRLEEYRSALITAAVTGQIDVETYAKSGTPDRRLDAIQKEVGGSEIVVPFEDESISSLLNDMNHADMLEPKPRKPKSDYIEFLVGRFNGIKIEIFANEHPPPHFRVKTSAGTGNFSIDTCDPLHGAQAVLRRHGEIKKWHTENRQALIQKWNDTRPSDCTVGKFREGDA